jgi:hypothetical protein
MTNTCQALNRDGSPCRANPLTGSDYCFHHDPDRAEERRLARRKGGRARHGRHLGPVGQAEPITLGSMADVAALLQETINETRRLENSIQRARTLGYLAGQLIKAMDMAELEDRVARIERTLNLRGNRP